VKVPAEAVASQGRGYVYFRMAIGKITVGNNSGSIQIQELRYFGILEPDKSFEINVQLYWNVQNGERDIKSGTPLMQLIPLTEELVNLVVRDANEDDMKMIRKRDYFMLSTFDYYKLRNKISEVYKKWIS